MLGDALTGIGIDASLEHFEDGYHALDALGRSPQALPNVIFLDINMPSISGWECLREIKKLAFMGHIPIMMYSTANLERERLNARDAGATAFLTKPDNFCELKSRLSILLAGIWQTD